MRMMLRVTLPVEAGNAAIKSGRVQSAISETMARLKPEAAYFTADKGQRTMYFFFDMSDSSQMPPIGEPFFMELNAAVELTPAMNADDLKKGLSQLPR